jgi:enoyl-CoA hydratase/carnithine racemase
VSYEHVIYEKKDRIAYVTLDRPEVMNAMNTKMHFELREIWEDFRDDDDVWVAILSGAGDRAFATGNDLKESASRDAKARAQERPPFAGMTSQYECSKPIIAAVHGYCVAGGFETALACDLIVAADNTQFSLPEVKVGLVAGAGGLHRLARTAPLKVTMGLVLTGRRISAEEAYRLGIVNEVVPVAELMTAAERWANEILDCAPLAVRLTKEAVLRGLQVPVEEAIARDVVEVKPRIRASADYLEGPRAFAEKRKPVWTGR